MISSIVVGLLTGALSSLAVATYFYKRGLIDADNLSRRGQLDSVLLRLKQLDPKRRQSVRPGDGVDDTGHWATCMSEIMAQTGFTTGADVLKSIIREMDEFCPPVPKSPERTHDEGERIKKQWEGRIVDLGAKLRRGSRFW